MRANPTGQTRADWDLESQLPARQMPRQRFRPAGPAFAQAVREADSKQTTFPVTLRKREAAMLVGALMLFSYGTGYVSSSIARPRTGPMPDLAKRPPQFGTTGLPPANLTVPVQDSATAQSCAAQLQDTQNRLRSCQKKTRAATQKHGRRAEPHAGAAAVNTVEDAQGPVTVDINSMQEWSIFDENVVVKR